jgi:N-glycosylase/DNA lyase
MKRNRVKRFLASPMMGQISERSIADLGKKPMEFWSELSMSMHQKPDDKTIVFAMKTFDLMHKAETGRYVRFPANIPNSPTLLTSLDFGSCPRIYQCP